MFKLFGRNKNGKKENFFLELKEDTPTAQPVKEEVVATEVPVAKAVKKEETKVAVAPAAKAVKKEETKAPVAKAVKKTEPVVVASSDAIAQTLSRRLPGPSLNKFKAMASQIRR
ncbi:MAG: hypothetical protein WCO81_07250 [Cyanobacteriota bacterium ELA615]|jgi:hypothetical protein